MATQIKLPNLGENIDSGDILTIMVNGIENGVDVTAEQDSLGKNMIRATLLYVAIGGITILIFGFIAGGIAEI